jgi:hypothetical protein
VTRQQLAEILGICSVRNVVEPPIAPIGGPRPYGD